MNERIKELWRGCVLKHTNDPMNWQTVADEFAELIVKECAKVAGDFEYARLHDSLVEDRIKEHFGVEELKPCKSPYCECDVGKCSHPGFYDARGEE
jgi:hypothetical protein